MQEYHDKTCVRFRPYHKNDTNWVEIRSDYGGCWSSVGMRTEGQVVNLNAPRCVRHGVVVHELMHACGFFHQQSAADRDDHVKINWENIREGRETNFKKYDSGAVKDFGIGYDYDSVMHYSSKAFSKNGQKTIEPLVSCRSISTVLFQMFGILKRYLVKNQDTNAKLGQRIGLSDRDVRKLNLMYEDTCNTDSTNVLENFEVEPEDPDNRDPLTTIMKWVQDYISH